MQDSKKMNVYISGKISNVPDLNIPKFKAAERLLGNRYGNGIIIFNPHNLPHFHDKTWESYMKVCLRVLTSCGAVFVLDDWKSSRGAIIEVLNAKWLAIPVYEIENPSTPIKLRFFPVLWVLVKLFGYHAHLNFKTYLKRLKNV